MTGITANRAANHRHTILMCCDDNYFPFATLLASQIAKAYPERNFDICILYSGTFPEHPIIKQLDLRLVQFPIPEAWQGLATSKKITLAAYLRIIAPRLLADDYDRVLYLDSDIYYHRGDIPALLSADLGGHPVAAVRDSFQHREMTKPMREFKAAGLEQTRYFNSGMLLVDVPQYLAQDIDGKAFEFAAMDGEDIRYKHDQSALNLALHNNWAELSPVWNWPCIHRTYFLTHFLDPCFFHFLSVRKPWKDKTGLYSKEHVRIAHEHLSAHFPDLANAMPARPKPETALGKWLWIFIRQVWDLRRITPYFNRFDGDFDIKK
ncbi:glycosyltransferase family 8 protein [Aliiroseovarius crassostreae]|uniref:glycosyltransferase family 8 protein n=1 Tax=Aliiroseovarius crassostreae TaxID=154981 RepID=UPI002202FDFA|nr:glycosyltransferase family 8 protein [Aliiroseovarius crassostreae]UWQ07900.1 glycosyltransferase family 8 protein [Aliiroseovarius crassostreae]UWQ11004.1 glycosyltransferase family 8 protein [Aliiroseovarius crassostreae]